MSMYSKQDGSKCEQITLLGEQHMTMANKLVLQSNNLVSEWTNNFYRKMYAKVNKKHHTWAIIQEEKHVQIILTCKQNVYTLHSQKKVSKGKEKKKGQTKRKEREKKKEKRKIRK